ncbi:winged helix DNA-binding domain-containing protein [Streptomyces sp. NPDC046215]|uniref:Winged helix DNA-binding domain-containing protein n=1 Tax=Streptomyces stramineus TaxID=173861 RepID=A0ABP3JB92_9ACTN
MTTIGAPVLSPRALGRALLERQLLLRRATLPALDAVEHLVGLQAQSPLDPYYALAARLDGFRPEDLARLLASREAVRIAVMRSTIHLVSARDCRTLRPLLQPVQDRGFRSNHGKRLGEVDLDRLAARARELVAVRPYTFHELGRELAGEWPGAVPQDLAMAARTLLPLVQVTPRALWGHSGPAAHTTVETWLGGGLDPAPDLGDMVLRYLAAFGPASVKDLQTWCGLTRLREVVDRLRPGLRTFRDAGGAELFDVPDGPLPDKDTPAPVRFLPEFDNLLLSHADRSRIIDPAHLRRLWRTNRAYRSFLLDGTVGGLWRLDRERAGGEERATVVVEPFGRIPEAGRAAVEDEAAGVLAMAAPDARHEVRYGEVA